VAALRGIDRDVLALAALVVVLLPVPLFLNAFQLDIAVQILLFALLGTAWNLMGGFSGQFSFGHAAFFGLGAYSAAVLAITFELSPWVAMAVGAAGAAALGAFIGYLSFRYRVKGVYFALTTFAFAEMLRLIVNGIDALGGPRGLNIPFMAGSSWFMIQFPQNSPAYYYVVLILMALGILAAILLIRSRTGMFILAIREDEDAAATLGVNPLRYKVTAIAASAALTAVGGVFYAQYYFFVDPNLAFGAAISIQILLPAIVGGVGTIWGPVIGAFIVTFLAQTANAFVRTPPAFLEFLGGRTGLDVVIYGAVLILIIMFLPRGIYGTAADFAKRRSFVRRMRGREAKA
jgi:branched-chain amino acid transport system permease protein